jgi:hypothetical protein
MPRHIDPLALARLDLALAAEYRAHAALRHCPPEQYAAAAAAHDRALDRVWDCMYAIQCPPIHTVLAEETGPAPEPALAPELDTPRDPIV